MSGQAKAAHGERKRQALEVIKKFEKAKKLWGMREVADELGISKQQAWSLLQSLTFTGELTRGVRTVVVEDVLVLAA